MRSRSSFANVDSGSMVETCQALKRKSRNGIAAKVFHFVLLGQEKLPLKKADGNVHAGQRKLGAAFLRERSA